MNDKRRSDANIITHFGWADRVLNGEVGRTFLASVDALIKDQIEYRWHDLRENPNDTPTGKKAFVMVVYENTLGRFGHYIDICGCSNGVFDEREDNIIAWRWIEPFCDDEV